MSDEVRAPMMPKKATNPSGEGESDQETSKHVPARIGGLLIAADAEEIGQVRREHGEPARIHGRDQTGPKGNRQIQVKHNGKVTA